MPSCAVTSPPLATRRSSFGSRAARWRSSSPARRPSSASSKRASCSRRTLRPATLGSPAWPPLSASTTARACHLLVLKPTRFVPAASPTASYAWIAGLASADRLDDRARFDELLRSLGTEPLPPSAAGLALLAELVARHTGPDGNAALARA